MDFIQVINPARFSEVVGRVPVCSESDLDCVLDQAGAAFKSWSRTTPDERASCLRAAARDLRNAMQELARLLVRENGKHRREPNIDDYVGWVSRDARRPCVEARHQHRER